MEGRLKYKVEELKDALNNFEESLSIKLEDLSPIVTDSVKSGRVQKFEFCIELIWNTVKVYLLEVNGIDTKGPKPAIKEFYNSGFLSAKEYEALIEAIDDRNKLSHVYKKQQFEEIYQRVIKTLPFFRTVLKNLK